MGLQQFIETVLKDIDTALINSSQGLSKNKWALNTFQNENKELTGIEFDVAVTVSDEGSAAGKAQVFPLLSANGEIKHSNQQVSRVKFTIVKSIV